MAQKIGKEKLKTIFSNYETINKNDYIKIVGQPTFRLEDFLVSLGLCLTFQINQHSSLKNESSDNIYYTYNNNMLIILKYISSPFFTNNCLFCNPLEPMQSIPPFPCRMILVLMIFEFEYFSRILLLAGPKVKSRLVYLLEIRDRIFE